MRKIYAVLVMALLSISFKTFDTTYFALTVPFSQDWTNTAMITANDNLAGVASIHGFRGDGLTGATGTDPQTILAADDPGVPDVNANQTNPNTFATGGVTEFEITNPVIALTGSGTATAPYIKIYLNTTGASNILVQYNLRDIDGSTDNAVQPVALQYRVGSSGAFTNIPAGFVADASSGPSLATLVTPVSVTLPAACNNQSQVQLRIITTNAVGNDEWIGIDDIVITPNSVGGGGNTVSLSGGGNIPEAGPAGTFTLTFSPATTVPTTVDYSLTPGTATLTTDYSITLNGGSTPSPLTTTTGTITVPALVSSVTFTVTPSNDLTTETNETIDLTISNASATYTVSGGNAVATIVDDDVPVLTGINYTGATYTQDFNTLADVGTSSTLPTGWRLSESGTNANTTYTANTGSGNSGDTYSFGTDPDRAFGGLRSGSLVPTLGARVDNNTGATITSLNIAYRGEQWRLGSIGRNDRLDFQYSLDATSLTTGTWVNVDGLDFIGPLSSGTTGAKDGNDPSNYVAYNFTINGLSIPAGNTFYIRWLDVESAGADDGLAIDNFSMSPGCTPPTNQPTVLNLTPALTSISGSFTDAAAGAVNANAYLVVVSTSPALTEQPLSGTTYAIDDAIGNGQVVSIGNSTSFTASGLIPATTYYFFIYSNSLPTNCYNTTTALTGSVATSSPPACTPPATPASGLSATTITGTSMDLNYTRGNGDNILIVARTGSAVNSNPINGVSYPAGSQIGTGNFVIYNGPANTFPYTGLTQNTTYYFALYEYSIATPCYNTSALTGNFTTTCVTPVNPTGFSPTPQNGAVFLSWTNPTLSCFDEILVIASTAPVTAAGNTFVGAGNPAYTGPGDQVVFRGVGTNVTVTGLTNGTNYYFKIFSRNSGSYSTGVQVNAVPFDPSTSFMYLYGNLHSHSSYSDGNADNLSKIPADDYAFARDANCMDFLGISEHNHSLAGMVISDYKLGYNQAEAVNGVNVGGKSILALWGMEWGTIGSGGHILVYGFGNQLIGWEPGNYDIYCNVGDYNSLLGLINNQPNAFASLAHPANTDYNDIRNTPYSATKDEAIVATAIESGPAFSHSTTYNDFPSPLSYMSYYRAMLARGYRIGASVDQDNHNMTFGTANTNRMVVLAPVKTRDELVNAIRNMRFYASQDCNVQVDYKINSGVVGSSVTTSGVPAISVNVVDGDGENVASIELWGGVVGGATPGSPIKIYPGMNTFTFNSGDIENIQPDGTTYYYYLVLTQDDGNKMVTSPIWFSRNDMVLPVSWLNFDAKYSPADKATLLTWTTAQEINSKEFVVERSTDGGRSWTILGTVAAAGTTNSFTHYKFSDLDPKRGTNLYRLRQVDIDGHSDYSKIVSVVIKDKFDIYFSVKPNPAISGVANVYASSTTTTKANIQLLDINGKMIREGQYIVGNTTPAKVDLTGVSQGVYFLRINYEGSISVEKILVK